MSGQKLGEPYRFIGCYLTHRSKAVRHHVVVSKAIQQEHIRIKTCFSNRNIPRNFPAHSLHIGTICHNGRKYFSSLATENDLRTALPSCMLQYSTSYIIPVWVHLETLRVFFATHSSLRAVNFDDDYKLKSTSEDIILRYIVRNEIDVWYLGKL